MIKPIDTQILHPQTPEIAGRQHKSNQLPIEQQAQFGNIMKKEVKEKRDTVVAPHKAEDLKTNKDGSKQLTDQNTKQPKKKLENKKTDKDKIQKDSANKIDIRI